MTSIGSSWYFSVQSHSMMIIHYISGFLYRIPLLCSYYKKGKSAYKANTSTQWPYNPRLANCSRKHVCLFSTSRRLDNEHILTDQHGCPTPRLIRLLLYFTQLHRYIITLSTSKSCLPEKQGFEGMQSCGFHYRTRRRDSNHVCGVS